MRVINGVEVEQEFTEFVAARGHALLQVAYALTGDQHAAEDLVQALPRAELVVMRGVGHAPQLEAPRHTARILEAFARRVERD